MGDSTSAAAVRETPNPPPAIFSVYRDIRASGAPKAVAACWRAVAERLTADGFAVIDYADIAKRAKCKRWAAIKAIGFGVALGCLERETAKLNRWRGDYMNATDIGGLGRTDIGGLGRRPRPSSGASSGRSLARA